ncbi:MAG: serine protease Do [Acidobacteriota bacterium]|jgi:serine protease Do|nr:serine protease Do [Acidobacteriota bacterium]
MKLKLPQCIVALFLLWAAAVAAHAQETAPALPPEAPAPPSAALAPDPPAAFATTFFAEGNFLGVRTEEVTRENASRYGLTGEPRGVGVREVVKGSPAERAGLRAGDLILRFDGEPVTSVRKLTRLIEEAAPGHAARLTVLRGGSEQEVSATLTHREPFVSASGDAPLIAMPYEMGDALRLGDGMAKNSEAWKRNEEKMRKQLEEMGRKHPGLFAIAPSRRIGVSTTPLGKQLADYFGVTHGVLINSVETNSPAEKAGLKAGDVVTEADGQQVEDAEDLVRALGAKDEGEVMLTVVRERKQRSVRVSPERRQPPQGFNLMPGSFRITAAPVAAVALPSMTVEPLPALAPRVMVMPRAALTPAAVVAPRVMAAPRVRVKPARVTVYGSDDRIL